MDRSPEPRSGGILGPREADREAVCPEHGPFTSRHIFRSVWQKCPACEEGNRRRQEAEKAERDAAQARHYHAVMLDAAAIPQRFIGRTFDGFVAPSDEHRHALTTARSYAEDFADHAARGRGLILAGMPGTGKTHLAAAILQALLPRPVSYVTCMDVIRAVRNTWRRDSERSETEVLRHLNQLDLLVIDEVGVQYGTDGEQTILFEVLDRRYRDVRPTILLTNQSKDGLKSFVGDRAFDRLSETCRWVPFTWPTYRPTARKEAAS